MSKEKGVGKTGKESQKAHDPSRGKSTHLLTSPSKLKSKIYFQP